MKEVAFTGFDDHEESQLPKRSESSVFPATRNFEDGVDITMVRLSKDRTSISEFATPLFGLVVRITSLDQFNDVEELHRNTRQAIEIFRRDLQNEGYDVNNLNAASYGICALIDESVMAHSWGAESIWPTDTMLSTFHNETWGGDQFFAILDRVLLEASRYPDLLEFLQMCLLLGFQGKYHVMPNGEKKLQELIDKIDKILREQNPDRELTRFVSPEANVQNTSQKGFDIGIGPWGIVGIWLVILVIVYAIFAVLLNSNTNTTQQELQNMLGVTASEIQEVQ